jgi:tight adherence protein C
MMNIVLKFALLCFFIAFYLIGRVLAEARAGAKVREITDSAAKKTTGGLNALSEKLVSPTSVTGYRKKIMEAGQPRGVDADGFIALKMIGALAGLALGTVVGVVFGFPLTTAALLAVFLTAIGFYAPDAWLSHCTEARKKEISLALPDILDMLTISVEAGLGFDAALTKVVKNFHGALSQEFFRFLQETQLGRSRRDAWRNLSERTNVPEVNSFVLAVLQADVFGVSIANVLRVQSEEMRTKRRQRAEEIAMKSPVKVVFPLVLCIFPALLVVILGPAMIRIYQSMSL